MARWSRISLALAMAVIAAFSFAQVPPAPKPTPDTKPQAPAKPKPVPPEEKWLYPAQRLSADIDSQSWRMRRDLHAIAWATLGATWWKQDRGVGEKWIYPAVDEVTIASQDEPELNRVRRLEAARRILALVTPLDKILGERMKDVVKAEVGRATDRPSAVPLLTADALVSSAEHGEPSQVAATIAESLQYGVSRSTVEAIMGLRAQAPEEAERLFSRALAQAASTGNPESMRVFSAVLISEENIPAQWRQAVADAFARVLTDESLSLTARCWLSGEFAGMTETVSGSLAAALATTSAACVLAGDPVVAADAQILQRSDPKTSDDYLSVAGQSRSPVSRYKLKLTAAEKAEKEDTESENGGPVRALRIVDNMTTEERAVRPGEYKRRRAEEAIEAALFSAGKSGCEAGLRVVDRSPNDTVFHLAVKVAEKMTGTCYREVVDIAFRQMYRLPADDPNDYVRFLNLVLRRGPFPEQSIQQILREMDRWKAKDPRTLPPGEFADDAPWNSLRPMPLAAELFNIPAERLSSITRNLRNDLLRVDLQLHLVRGFLDHYAREKAKAEVASD